MRHSLYKNVQLCVILRPTIHALMEEDLWSHFQRNQMQDRLANLVHKQSEDFAHSNDHKGQFEDFEAVMRKYVDMGHAELVPDNAMGKSESQVFYLPMHAVYKSSSTTTKIRAVFDASAKSASGVSLNDTLLVGQTVHFSLIDVLFRFRHHRIALTADVSKMYRAVALVESDRDLHRFV